MKFINTPIKDLWIIEPTVFEDARGYFFESFHQNNFLKHTGIQTQFVQDNESKSSKGVLRGLHFQQGEHVQAKLVRVLAGEVQDVVVDLRNDSPTFGKSFSIVLNASNRLQLFVPRGFAHSFLVLSETAVFSYKCDNFYNKESESGILYSCEQLNIDWLLPKNELILSEKDEVLPPFDANNNYDFTI